MIINRLCLYTVTLCATLASVGLSAKETIIWTKYDFAPLYIKDGADQDNGIVDQQMKILASKITGYQHEYDYGSIARIEEAMKKKEAGVTVCTSWLKNDKRMKVSYYSNPSRVLPTHKIIVLKDNRDKFKPFAQGKDGNTLSLENLLTESPFILGVAKGRSYAKNIDKSIKGKSNVYARSGAIDSKGLLNMLVAHRVDYIIEYPWLFSYEMKRYNKAETSAFSIKEAHKDSFGYFSCTKNESGKNIVARINEILKEELPKPYFREILEQWIPAELITSFREKYLHLIAMAKPVKN